MREILFRAKRKDNDEWVMGMPCAADQYGIFAIQTLTGMGPVFFIVPETLGQYIGLTDENGEKIFEGDVLAERAFGSKNPPMGVVEYGDFNCGCCYGVYGWFLQGYADIRESKNCGLRIVGNIHDNPELIEEANK
jgi:uncharacterized phage protein (TIGR01671 family)